MATQEMWMRLPKLDDDDNIGIEMEHIVQRDGEADLKFTGKLLASVAPEFREQDRWREYRVYQTGGGTYVFSKIGRSIVHDEHDKFEAIVWNEGKTLDKDMWLGIGAETLRDGLTSFFKFDQLAKQLYAKLNVDTAQKID